MKKSLIIFFILLVQLLSLVGCGRKQISEVHLLDSLEQIQGLDENTSTSELQSLFKKDVTYHVNDIT